VVLLKFFFIGKKTLYWIVGILVAIIGLCIIYYMI